MERTSIITSLYLAKASDYPSVTLVNGLPNANSLAQFFYKAPLVIERSDLRETNEDSDQGELLDIAIRANIYRDSQYHLLFSNKLVLAYIETANGEKYFFGSKENPLIYRYNRDSGATNEDSRFTTLSLGLKLPL